MGISSGVGQSSSVQSLVYQWDGYGNLEERQDTNRALSESFNYDGLNRLTYSGVTNPNNDGPSLSFVYDAMGNIQTKTLTTSSGSTVDTYGYSDINHPYAVTSVTNASGTIYNASYDANGNMALRNNYQLAWTVDNFPESISSAQGSSTFDYGPDKQRYYQSATFNTVMTDTTYIDGLFEVIESQASTVYRHNIFANGQVIAVHSIDEDGNAATSYIHYDHLGSVDTITDDQGTVATNGVMSFDAVGLRRDASNWMYDLSPTQIATLKNYTDQGYTNQEQLDNVDLIHMNGRVYDPIIIRFISSDPYIPDSIYSQSFNRYSYVYNNPLTITDSSGYCANYNNINSAELMLGTWNIAKGAVTEIGGGILYMSAVAGSFESFGASLLWGGVGAAGVVLGGETLKIGLHQTADSLNGTVYESQMPSAFEMTSAIAEIPNDPLSALLDASISKSLENSVQSPCDDQNKNKSPNNVPQPKPNPNPNQKPNPGTGPEGGGSEGQPNRFPTELPTRFNCTTIIGWDNGNPGNIFVQYSCD